jgi:putative Mn2+ efflux pump MntP
MDAFAVSIERGISIQQIKWTQALLIAFLFGSFQTIMPLIGLKAGEAFFVYISAIDHWFALLVLSLIGFKMIYEAIKHTEEENQKSCQLTISSLLLLSLATSIDSLAVGLSLTAANLPKNIVILSIGATENQGIGLIQIDK